LHADSSATNAAAGAPAGRSFRVVACTAACAAAACVATASLAAASAAATVSGFRTALAAPAAAAALAVDRAVSAPDEALVGGSTAKGMALALCRDGTLLPPAATLPGTATEDLAGGAGATAPQDSKFSRPSFVSELTHPSGVESPSRATRVRFVPSTSSPRSKTTTRVPAGKLPVSSLSSSRPARILSLPMATSTSPCVEPVSVAVLDGDARGVVAVKRDTAPRGEAGARGVMTPDARGVVVGVGPRDAAADVFDAGGRGAGEDALDAETRGVTLDERGVALDADMVDDGVRGVVPEAELRRAAPAACSERTAAGAKGNSMRAVPVPGCCSNCGIFLRGVPSVASAIVDDFVSEEVSEAGFLRAVGSSVEARANGAAEVAVGVKSLVGGADDPGSSAVQVRLRPVDGSSSTAG